MYESPITVMTDQITRQINMEYDNAVMKAVYSVGILVDKEELLKALKYDREQYNKGYDDAVNEYMRLLCEHCMQQTNECYKLECPFCGDGCEIIRIAEQMKGGAE